MADQTILLLPCYSKERRMKHSFIAFKAEINRHLDKWQENGVKIRREIGLLCSRFLYI